MASHNEWLIGTNLILAMVSDEGGTPSELTEISEGKESTPVLTDLHVLVKSV